MDSKSICRENNKSARRAEALTLEILKATLSYDSETGEFSRANGSKVGAVDWDGYLRIGIRGRKYRASRLAWFWMTGEQSKVLIEHRNGIRTDNRYVNLREATASQNMQNIRRPRRRNKSGLLGVSTKSPGKFEATIKLNGKSQYLGLFDNAEDAQAAYFKAKNILHPFQTIAAS